MKQPAVTSLAQIKSVAKAFLYFGPERTESSPITVRHPFANSAFVGIHREGKLVVGNILDNPADISLWREEMKQQIERTDTVSALVAAIMPSYLLGFLKFVKPFLSKGDLGETLSYCWRNCEAPNRDPNLRKPQILAMFKKADPATIMDEEEIQRLAELPETVTVYRGVTSLNEKDRKALSWTTDPYIASWFAHRYGEDGKVFTAKISKEYIYACFTGRGESEVILDPNMLQEITISEGE